VKTFFMHITDKEGVLWMNLQGHEVENYQLHHYTGDEFSWPMTRNEQIKRGRNPIGYAVYWKIRFVSENGDGVAKVF
jgi:hypothetical protein